MRHTHLTPDDQDKIQMIDDVFNAFTKEELKELLGQELVVNKLKGIPTRTGILQSLVFDNLNQDLAITKLENDINSLRNDIFQARSDTVVLLKFINDRFNGYSSHKSEFDSLKGRYGIY